VIVTRVGEHFKKISRFVRRNRPKFEFRTFWAILGDPVAWLECQENSRLCLMAQRRKSGAQVFVQ
jgi:hypothetical protein